MFWNRGSCILIQKSTCNCQNKCHVIVPNKNTMETISYSFEDDEEAETRKMENKIIIRFGVYFLHSDPIGM